MNHPLLKQKLEEYSKLQDTRNEKVIEVLKSLQNIVSNHAKRLHKLEDKQ